MALFNVFFFSYTLTYLKCGATDSKGGGEARERGKRVEYREREKRGEKRLLILNSSINLQNDFERTFDYLCYMKLLLIFCFNSLFCLPFWTDPALKPLLPKLFAPNPASSHPQIKTKNKQKPTCDLHCLSWFPWPISIFWDQLKPSCPLVALSAHPSHSTHWITCWFWENPVKDRQYCALRELALPSCIPCKDDGSSLVKAEQQQNSH